MRGSSASARPTTPAATLNTSSRWSSTTVATAPRLPRPPWRTSSTTSTPTRSSRCSSLPPPVSPDQPSVHHPAGGHTDTDDEHHNVHHRHHQPDPGHISVRLGTCLQVRSSTHGDDAFPFVTLAAGELDEFAHLSQHRPALRRTVTVMPLPRPNSTSPSSRRMCIARRTVFLFTPRTAAMSLASGRRSRWSAFGDRTPNFGSDLIMQQRGVGSVDVHRDHGAINSRSVDRWAQTEETARQRRADQPPDGLMVS